VLDGLHLGAGCGWEAGLGRGSTQGRDPLGAGIGQKGRGRRRVGAEQEAGLGPAGRGRGGAKCVGGGAYLGEASRELWQERRSLN
jgi:hypothetical protein